jgi:hypothetical protein
MVKKKPFVKLFALKHWNHHGSRCSCCGAENHKKTHFCLISIAATTISMLLYVNLLMFQACQFIRLSALLLLVFGMPVMPKYQGFHGIIWQLFYHKNKRGNGEICRIILSNQVSLFIS